MFSLFQREFAFKGILFSQGNTTITQKARELNITVISKFPYVTNPFLVFL